MLEFIDMMFGGDPNAPFTLNIVANVANPNIPTLATNAGWNGKAPLVVNITAALVSSLNFPSNWSFPGGVTLKISSSTLVGGVASGGTAIITRVPLKIENFGAIYGGGGPGGNGQGVYAVSTDGYQFFANGGAGGRGQGFESTSSVNVLPALAGAQGESIYYLGANANGGKGGDGGGWGQYGASGGYGSWNPSGGNWYAAGAGQPPGAYIDGNSYVTWLANGTRAGRVI